MQKKSTISREGVEEEDMWCFSMQLGFKVINLDEGLKYLGFCLKPSYRISD